MRVFLFSVLKTVVILTQFERNGFANIFFHRIEAYVKLIIIIHNQDLDFFFHMRLLVLCAGRMVFKTESLHRDSIDKGLIPVKYVDDSNIPTSTYPLNPNGSPGGAAGLCSADGRHLALMPHPERCVLPWQWPWMPSNWRRSIKTSPWLRMFNNAYAWCE